MFKSICDKIIISIFILIEFIGFLLVASKLPNFLNFFFKTDIFKNSTTISYMICIFIAGYSLNYFENIKREKENELSNLKSMIKLFTKDK